MAKGSQFERDVCRQLSLWWTEGLNANVFWRTSNSGGRATVRRQQGRAATVHCGDICAIDPVGQPLLDLFAIEVKRGYASATLHDLLDKPETAKQQTFEKWIEQAQASRDQARVPYWLLITRRDRRETLVTMPRRFLPVGDPPELTCWLEDYGGSSDLLICRLVYFLSQVHPERLREIAKEKKDV